MSNLPPPPGISTDAATVELINHARFQSEQLSKQTRLLNQQNARSRAIGRGAMVAAMLGALWALEYLLTTSFGSTITSQPMLSYVIGREHGIGAAGNEPLFIIVTRFLLAFGLLWPGFSWLFTFVENFVKSSRD